MWRKYKWILMLVIVFGGYYLYQHYTAKDEPPPPPIPTLNELADLMASETIIDAEVNTLGTPDKMTFTLKDGTTKTFSVLYDQVPAYTKSLLDRKIPVRVKMPEKLSFSWDILINILVVLMLMTSTLLQRSALFGSNIRMKPQKSDIRFNDVAGIDEVRDQCKQMIAFLKNPKKLASLGGRPPKGTLFVGPPGTGKTMLARAIAGEADVPYFSVSGSEFDEMFVGLGARRVRKMFKTAKKHAPCIIFIDELDAVGKKRKGGDSGNSQTLNQLLTCMDGFEGDTGIILLGATNRPDDLDPALRRPGRFDREVTVPLPSVKGREEILNATVKRRKAPLEKGLNLGIIARMVAGFSGAQLVNLLNEAALYAASNEKEDKKTLTLEDFEHAREQMVMGLPNSTIISAEEKFVLATHEAGHTLVALRYAKSGLIDPIYKGTILPRGEALGMVATLPEIDRVTMSRARLKAILELLAGGRSAEVLILGEDNVTSGAASDLQKSAQLANRMVTEWGFTATGLGKQAFRQPGDAHSGTIGQLMDVSDETRFWIDDQVNSLLQQAIAENASYFTEHRDVLNDIRDLLLEKESVTGDELREKFLARVQAHVLAPRPELKLQAAE